jgi:hypothetical protein
MVKKAISKTQLQIKSIEADLKSAEKEIFGSIDQLYKTHPYHLDPKSHPENFQKYIVPFLQAQRRLFKEWQPTIEIFADRISQITDDASVERKNVVLLWFRLADKIIAQFGEHPDRKKRVGGLLVSANNKKISFGVNAIPGDIDLGYVPLRGFLKGHRKNYCACAEPNCFAKPLGVSVPWSHDDAESSEEAREYLISEKVAKFISQIRWPVDLANTTKDSEAVNPIAGSTLFVSTPPCGSCLSVTINNKPAAVVFRRLPVAEFSRGHKTYKCAQSLTAHGIAVGLVSMRKVKVLNPTPQP